MSIRLRLTLIYSAILTLTLVIFGGALYTIQASYTLKSLKKDLMLSADNLVQSVLFIYLNPLAPRPRLERPFAVPFDMISGDRTFRELREREIVRLLDVDGTLMASPLGGDQESLPLSSDGLQAVQDNREWWDISVVSDERMLIYNRPVAIDGQVLLIAQVGRSLTEYDRSLATLGITLGVASIVVITLAFGIGWVIAGATLGPIGRIAQTAEEIGNESDFARRVDYQGPRDEVPSVTIIVRQLHAKI